MLQPRIEGRLAGEGEKDGVGAMMPDSLHPYTRMRLSGHYLEWRGWGWLEIDTLEEWRQKNDLLAGIGWSSD